MRGEYTPLQISFDLGSAVHREALFQVLLTLEQAEEEPKQQACCPVEGCSCPDEEASPEEYSSC